MGTKLNEEEERFVQELLNWDQLKKPTGCILYNLFLTFGGIVIVVVCFLTIQHLTDRTALWVTVPGFLVGLFLIGLYLVEKYRTRERRLVASVLKKLQSDDSSQG